MGMRRIETPSLTADLFIRSRKNDVLRVVSERLAENVESAVMFGTFFAGDSKQDFVSRREGEVVYGYGGIYENFI